MRYSKHRGGRKSYGRRSGHRGGRHGKRLGHYSVARGGIRL